MLLRRSWTKAPLYSSVIKPFEKAAETPLYVAFELVSFPEVIFRNLPESWQGERRPNNAKMTGFSNRFIAGFMAEFGVAKLPVSGVYPVAGKTPVRFLVQAPVQYKAARVRELVVMGEGSASDEWYLSDIRSKAAG